MAHLNYRLLRKLHYFDRIKTNRAVSCPCSNFTDSTWYGTLGHLRYNMLDIRSVWKTCRRRVVRLVFGLLCSSWSQGI